LRYAGASLLENNNVPVGVIQKVLGHENRKTTEIYLHNLNGSDREAMAYLDQPFKKKSHTQHHDSLTEHKWGPIKYLKSKKISGGGKRTRTADPLRAKQVLFQLSYTPTVGNLSLA